jgi:membrane fusion protein, multidrug efflux system
MKKLALIAVAVSLTLACSSEKPKPKDERVPVMVAPVVQRDVPVQISVIGSVQPYSTVAVRSQVAGQLMRVWFKEGESVRAGQRLFIIDPRPYEAALAQAEANVARDQAQLKNAEADAARYADLVKKDFVTRQDYDRITSGAEAARATVAADRAAVQNAKLQLQYCEITAPVDGRTGNVTVKEGNILKPIDVSPIVTINQVQPVYVSFAVPEAQFAQVRNAAAGLPVTAIPQNGGAPITGGKLTFVDNAVDMQTGTINLKATFPNSNNALWPGEYVNVAMMISNRANALVVPIQAVQNGQKGQYVYVVTDGGGVEFRPVTVIQQVDNQAVIGKGVTAGETVVTDGQIRLTAKSKIDVKKSL